MRVAVAGGTGGGGAARGRGGRRGKARAGGADPVSPGGRDHGAGGLQAALRGSHPVIGVSGVSTASRGRSVAIFKAATEHHLLDVGHKVGVGHHVALSIVGIDRYRRSSKPSCCNVDWNPPRHGLPDGVDTATLTMPVIDGHRLVGVVTEADVARNAPSEKVIDLVQAVYAN